MRHAFSIALILLAIPTRSAAQDVPGLSEARAIAQCVHEQSSQIQHLMRLIEQAEQRARASGVAEDVRRDAITSIEALVDRVRAHAQQARHCIERHPIAVRADSHTTETTRDPAHESLAGSHGTVHEVEGEGSLSGEVHVVRGERVDGSGSAPDESVRAAIRAVGPRISQCYGEFVDRASLRSGELHLAFTVEGGGRARARVEGGTDFDAAMRQCIQRAAAEIRVSGQRGRSVYAYTLRFGT